MANTGIVPQVAYRSRWDSNLDCMTKEPLSYGTQLNRVTFQVKALLPFDVLYFGYVDPFSALYIFVYICREWHARVGYYA